MSLGDGKAVSIARVGRTVILPIADGKAFVNAATRTTKEKVYISAFADADSIFNFAFNISNNKLINKTIFKPCEIFVETGIRNYIKDVKNYNQNQITVSSKTSPLMSCVINAKNKTSDNKQFLKYLWFRDEQKSVYACNVLAYDAGTTKITQSGNSNALCYPVKRKDNIMTVIENKIRNPILVTFKDESKFVIKDLEIMVENIVPNNFNAKLNIQPLYIPVEDYKPPDIGNITTGGSLKGFRLVMQKLAYMEQYLSFYDKSIKDITGLPQGLFYENGYLKGSPNISGKFNINIKFDDNTSMPGLIVVTQVPREF
jgi:hypothetical protein